MLVDVTEREPSAIFIAKFRSSFTFGERVPA